MNSPEITSAVLAEHRRDLRREQRGVALASMSRCCCPSAWARAAQRLTRSLTGGPRPGACPC